jgi:hypothetical protein
MEVNKKARVGKTPAYKWIVLAMEKELSEGSERWFTRKAGNSFDIEQFLFLKYKNLEKPEDVKFKIHPSFGPIAFVRLLRQLQAL